MGRRNRDRQGAYRLRPLGEKARGSRTATAFGVVLLWVACASRGATGGDSSAPAHPSSAGGASPSSAAFEDSRGVTVANVAPTPPPDPCHLDDELGSAQHAIAESMPRAAWLAEARSRLLPDDEAERNLGGIAQEIVFALAYKRYEKLAPFVDEKGLCLRAEKGAPCEMLSVAELTACGHSGKKRAFALNGGANKTPEYTCKQAFRSIFYARDFLRTKEVHFNCFPEPGRGNNPAPVVLSGPAPGYVEFHDPGVDGAWRSLWLVFDGEPKTPVLVEMISEYGR